MGKAAPHGDGGILTVLAKVAEWVALPTAYLFFAGFLYAYYYFGALGVSMRRVDLPSTYFPIYAFSVFMDNWLLLLTWAMVIGLCVYVMKRSPQWGLVGLIVVLLLTFPVLWRLARTRAYEEATLLRNGYEGRRITFTFLDEPIGTMNPSAGERASLSRLLDANVRGELVLVLETADVYYVLHQIYPETTEIELPRARLFEIPRDHVTLAEVKLPSVLRIREEEIND